MARASRVFLMVVNLTYGYISVVDTIPRANEVYKPVTDEVVRTLAAVGRAMDWTALTRIHTVVMANEIRTPTQLGPHDCGVMMVRAAAAAASADMKAGATSQATSEKLNPACI